MFKQLVAALEDDDVDAGGGAARGDNSRLVVGSASVHLSLTELKWMQVLQNLCRELGEQNGTVTFKQLVAALEGDDVDAGEDADGDAGNDDSGEARGNNKAASRGGAVRGNASGSSSNLTTPSATLKSRAVNDGSLASSAAHGANDGSLTTPTESLKRPEARGMLGVSPSPLPRSTRRTEARGMSEGGGNPMNPTASMMPGSPRSVTLQLGQSMGYIGDDEANTRHVTVAFESENEATGALPPAQRQVQRTSRTSSALSEAKRSTANPLFRAGSGSLSSVGSDAGLASGVEADVDDSAQVAQASTPGLPAAQKAAFQGRGIGKKANEPYNPQQLVRPGNLEKLDVQMGQPGAPTTGRPPPGPGEGP
jgi:hypothetical protein